MYHVFLEKELRHKLECMNFRKLTVNTVRPIADVNNQQMHEM